jgi:putative phosphoesterase
MNCKKMLVLSDTHGSLSALKKVMNWAKDRMPPNDTICDAVFLGDGVSDLRLAADAAGFYGNWNVVRGNNDYEHAIQDSAVFDFADYRFFICHGHRHSLYSGHHTLVSAGRSNNANVVMFGHTHVPFLKNEGGILLINPGSVGRPRSRTGATFAVIECIQGEPLKVKFYGIGSGGILEIKFKID